MKFAIVVTVVVSIFLIVGISIAQKDSQQTPSKSKEMPKEIIGKDGAKMVLIPAGEFQMGTDPAEIPELVKLAKQWVPDKDASWFDHETPRHTVSISAFYMDACEVTNSQYRKFMQATGHEEPIGMGFEDNEFKNGFKPWGSKNYNGDNQPVVCISWEDAKAYAEWAGKRLSTEAEWEYAARGGLAGKRYVWGNDWPPPKGSGNYVDETAKKMFPEWSIINGYDDGYAYTSPVGSFKSNGYGLYDMAGNVQEWCADWYSNKYYANSSKSNPKGPDSDIFRVIRGGSWGYYYPGNLHVAARTSSFPTLSATFVGFRCVVSITP